MGEAPPYFVAPEDGPACVAQLREAGFRVVEVDARSSPDERGVLTALGRALEFPDYYGRNWAAFADCMADVAAAGGGPLAAVIYGLEALQAADIRSFVRTVHLLLDAVQNIERAQMPDFQFEVVFVGAFGA